MLDIDVLLKASGLIQLTFGVLLGWPLALFHTGLTKVGPFVSMKRVLQSHIDNMLMGIIQLVLSMFAPADAAIAGLLIMIGAWVNPQIFLAQACLPGPKQLGKPVRVISTLSFIVTSVGFVWFLVATLPVILAS